MVAAMRVAMSSTMEPLINVMPLPTAFRPVYSMMTAGMKNSRLPMGLVTPIEPKKLFMISPLPAM